MTLEDCCRRLDMPQPVAEAAARLQAELPWEKLAEPMEGLFHRRSWEEALSRLGERLAPDLCGLKLLTVMLACLPKTWEWYVQREISPEIFWDTMGAFPRFCRECRRSTGAWGFDRGFWTPRQLSGELMRIGTLEYERLEAEDGPVVALHIPSDASLTPENVAASVRQARAFLAEKFPRWSAAPITCDSWLLSPELGEMLPDTSRILAFQKNFRMTGTWDDCRDPLQWVFWAGPNTAVAELPEQTGLQRALKAFWLAGGNFRGGRGVWREP